MIHIDFYSNGFKDSHNSSPMNSTLLAKVMQVRTNTLDYDEYFMDGIMIILFIK